MPDSTGETSPTLLSVRCNLCGAADDELVCFDQSFRIGRCPRCSLVYVNPQPLLTRGQDVQFYEDEEIAADAGFLRPKLPVYAQGLKLLDRAVPGRGRLLDVGCGLGVFLDQARKRGWDVYGTDVSGFAVDYAQREFGLTSVRRSDLSSAAYPDGFFQAVTLWNLLEHVPDPRALLGEVRRIVDPRGGMVLVRVPNMLVHDVLRHVQPVLAPLLRRVGKRPLPYLGGISPPQHLYGFTPSTLRALLEDCDYATVRVTAAVSHSSRPPLGRVIATVGSLFSLLPGANGPMSPAILATAAVGVRSTTAQPTS